jgi:hypothetical protein
MAKILLAGKGVLSLLERDVCFPSSQVFMYYLTTPPNAEIKVVTAI